MQMLMWPGFQFFSVNDSTGQVVNDTVLITSDADKYMCQDTDESMSDSDSIDITETNDNR